MGRVCMLAYVLFACSGCALLPEGDPRGQWGYFENSRSVSLSELPLKSRPWGDKL